MRLDMRQPPSSDRIERYDSEATPMAGSHQPLQPADVDMAKLAVPESVLHLVPDGVVFDRKGARRQGPIPTPQPFAKQSRELRKLRSHRVWQEGTHEDQVDQMERWFPDMTAVPTPTGQSTPARKTALSSNGRTSEPQLLRSADECPVSDIGDFDKLPGELRNRIYRLAILDNDEQQPFRIETEPGTCSQGVCSHSRASYNLPGVASTCHQMRWEVMPIICAESTAVEFDDSMVQQCCVGNFLSTLGTYADLFPEFRFLMKRPIWDMDRFDQYVIYTFALITPKRSADGLFKLEQYDEDGEKVCQCALDQLIEKIMNGRSTRNLPVGKVVKEFADSEELADFVWRMRKSKQWQIYLSCCEECGEVTFNR